MSGSTKRELWSGKIGFIIAAAGSAVGLGNIWRFPYLVGMNGGAAFVLVYLLLAITVGSTVMIAEFCMGRATRRNAVGAFRVLTKNPIWRIVGWLAVLVGGFIILSYYGIIAGWTFKYMYHSLTGLMDEALAGHSGDVLGAFLGDTKLVIAFQVLAMAITTVIVAGGVSRGIERACKVMMPVLFILLIVLIIRAVTLPGATDGLLFFLKPDFSKLTWKSLLDALGQSFYSLSLGMGIMITYGSYIPKDDVMPKSCLIIIILDTLIAFLAGLVIFPAVFAMGIEPSVGVGLTFVTLPGVFAMMPGGMYFSFTFFLLLSFAALTSMMSLLEVTVSFIMDEFKTSRAVAAWAGGAIITAMGIPSAISLAGGLKIAGMDFFDFVDSISNNIIMPLAAIGVSLYVGWKWADQAKMEITNNGTIRFAAMPLWMIGAKFFAPVMIAIIMINGWPF